MSDLMNELISHEAVYRTVPATPGLLIMYIASTFHDGCLRSSKECEGGGGVILESQKNSLQGQ